MPLVFAQPQPGGRLGYEHTRPVPVPEDLEDLHGPAQGVVDLPVRVDRTPCPFYDLSKDSSIRSLYRTVLRSAVHIRDVTAFLNRELLVATWPKLRIPTRVRAIWEARFPELRD